MDTLKNFLFSFVPQGLTGGQVFRAQILVVFMFLLSLVGLAYTPFYFYPGNYVGGGFIAFQVLLFWGLMQYLKSSGKVEKTLHLAAGSFTVMMMAITLSSGGSLYSATPWAAVPALFATLVVGSRAGALWFGVGLVFYIGTYIVGALGVPIPYLFTDDPDKLFWVRLLDFLHYIGCALYYVVVAFVFDYINTLAQNEAGRSLKKAEQASELAEQQARYLGENVERILIKMRKLANGNLTTQLEIIEEDEIGRLCEGFNIAVGRVRETISEVAGAVAVTVRSSEHISNAAGQLTTGTERQNDAVIELSSDVEQLVGSIAQNAESAAVSSHAARKNGDVAEMGGRIVARTVDKIEQIAEVVLQSARSIEALAHSSKEIGEIVRVIQDIAGRTNLLALNASIEAASAGDAGRGFNVIAMEVKDLAEQTGRSTQQISDVIATVQSEIKRVTDDMGEGMKRVEEGKQLAGQAGGALDEIVTSSSDLMQLVEAIAKACEDQSEQSQRFLDRIASVKDVTNQSVTEIRGIADSTNTLEGLTERLQEQLSRFEYQAPKGSPS